MQYTKCKTCRFWADWLETDAQFGQCLLINQEGFEPLEDGIELTEQAVIDVGEVDMVSLRTRYDFGCVLHQPITVKSPET